MKQLWTIIPALALVAGLSSGCVENNPYVILNGVVPGDCDRSSDDQPFLSAVYCMPTQDHIKASTFFVNVKNYISSDSGWSSSSGSSSGSSFEPEPPNRGMIFAKKIITKCKSIDGDSGKCKGIDNITANGSGTPILPGTGACISYSLDLGKIATWGASDSIVLDVQVEYEDPGGLIEGKTNHSYITISNVGTPCTKNPFVTEDEESGNDSSGGDSSGGDSSGGGSDKENPSEKT